MSKSKYAANTTQQRCPECNHFVEAGASTCSFSYCEATLCPRCGATASIDYIGEHTIRYECANAEASTGCVTVSKGAV